MGSCILMRLALILLLLRLEKQAFLQWLHYFSPDDSKVCPKSYATALVKLCLGLVEALLKISVRTTNQQGFIAKFLAYLH
jgi:hypothetical protein